MAVPSSAAPKRAAQRPFTTSQLMTEGRFQAGPLNNPKLPTEKTASPVGLEEAVDEVLDSDPQLRKFYNLRRKAVRTSVEQQDYLMMIADAKLIADARKDLLEVVSNDDLDQIGELKRLQRIRFLNSALAWKNNPERSKALTVVIDAILLEIPASASKTVAGSMLGDKVDLFQLLMSSDPDQAKALLAKSRGTPLANILDFAWQTGTPTPRASPH